MLLKNKILTPAVFAKEGYNRIRLRKAWANAASTVKKGKGRFDMLIMDYGDSRKTLPEARRRRLSEGLKICR
jgi:hypothetical protein